MNERETTPGRHSPEDKARIVRRVLEGEDPTQVARDCGVSPERIAVWRSRALSNLEAVFTAPAAIIRKLRKSEARYRDVVEEQVDLIRRFKSDGTLTFVNSAFCRFYEQPRQALLGRTFTALLLPEEREYIARAIYSLTPENPLVITEPRYVRSDGDTRWIQYVTRALFDAKGRAQEFQSVGRDITAQKLEERRNQEAREALQREHEQLATRFQEKVLAATRDKEAELSTLRSMLAEQAGLNNMGVFSDSMWQVVRQAGQYHTDRSLPVLIQGETGVGKEVIAKIIHYGNDIRETRPFIAINCTAITPSLFESELFGYEAGAFTGGAQRGQKGKLDMARGGTLFLDEIAEIPVELQAKLLRVLEDKSFYRVGGLKKIDTDIRIIAATNLDFEDRIRRGLFRRDLYYRLKVGRIVIPPLRERKDDIVPLARMFLEHFSQKRGRRFKTIGAEAAAMLEAYPWPGNVRELRNAMEWVSFMHNCEELRVQHFDKLLADNMPASVSPPGNRPPRTQGGYRVPDTDIDEALTLHNGNKTRAARYLGIAVRTLYYHLERRAKK